MKVALQEIFDDALQIKEPAERGVMLDRVCAGDGKLRERIEELLAVAGHADQFFTDCVTAVATSAEELVQANSRNGSAGDGLEEPMGSNIGPYKLFQKIGEGGCGVVYMAEQESPIRRRVALKIIKPGMDTKSVIARFEAEQQALALMDHPNIARVLDAGATQNGRPFFVMELVHGVRLTQFCDENCFNTKQRLQLFIQVCHAIQHAHQKGIIHRDIKPSNILVTQHDGVPVPKVIDFGIAKAMEENLTDKNQFTLAGLFIGTPAYMSPEQTQLNGLDVDTRSDIYSLGVLLYELLTGKTPFDQNELMAAGLDEMRRTLCDQEPRKPSAKVNSLAITELTVTAHRRHMEPPKLRSELQGDLDWVVMKALEKDRSRRYQTANGLALDVQRYIDNEPVLARPPSRLYRLQKLVRRNRATFVATGLVALALTASTIVSSWLFLREREARQRALQAEQQKSNLQQEADRLRDASEENRKFLKAAEFYRRGQNLEADALLDQIKNPKITPEYAPMYRALGDWQVNNNHWPQALDRFAILARINNSEHGDSSLDDQRYVMLLIDQNKIDDYERFRELLISRTIGTSDSQVAQRVIRQCLLIPANDGLMQALSRLAELTQKSIETSPSKVAPFAASYCSYALALMAYRQGNYDAAVDWCNRALNYNQGVQARDVSIRLILAMAKAQRGEGETAQTELAACRKIINGAFNAGLFKQKTWQGFWFDWYCARIHLREAEALIESHADKVQ